jgi:hypothetical protein
MTDLNARHDVGSSVIDTAKDSGTNRRIDESMADTLRQIHLEFTRLLHTSTQWAPPEMSHDQKIQTSARTAIKSHLPEASAEQVRHFTRAAFGSRLDLPQSLYAVDLAEARGYDAFWISPFDPEAPVSDERDDKWLDPSFLRAHVASRLTDQ